MPAGVRAGAAQSVLRSRATSVRSTIPVVIKEKGTYYVFCTGGRNGQGVLPIRTSRICGRGRRPASSSSRCPSGSGRKCRWRATRGRRTSAYFNGKYHLYYSVSSFGSRNSAIGLATTRTLDPSSPDYRWTDEGMVLRSYQDKDDWNAIDPNLVLDGDRAWLVWGSFWGGIKMRRVDPSSGKLSAADETMHALSSRPREQPINGSVEAPFIVRHGDYWYLFVSFDRCCRGAESTYNVVVGRSRSVTGPYVDRSGKPMTEGGGTLVIEATTPTWRGPGHPAVFSEGGKDFMFFHAYFGEGRGRGSALQISTMVWEDGWPKVGALP